MNDDGHIHPLLAALPDVAAERSGAMTPMRELYGAVQRHALANGIPTIPLGPFVRVLRRLGFPVLNRRGTDGIRQQHVQHLALRVPGTNNGAERHKETDHA